MYIKTESVPVNPSLARGLATFPEVHGEGLTRVSIVWDGVGFVSV